jgi:low affinity Fe/Cu permease
MRERPKAIETFSQKLTEWTGSSAAFIIALVISIGWAVSGPVFHYSDTWQLVINTITNVATFLMVFIIQRSQNKDAVAINVKLNELIAAVKGASNSLISAEHLPESELKTLQEDYRKLPEIAQRRRKESDSLTIEDRKNPATERRVS